jgi:hypothetical protein
MMGDAACRHKEGALSYTIPTLSIEAMDLPVSGVDIGMLHRILADWQKRNPFQRDHPMFVRLATKIDYLRAVMLREQPEQPELHEAAQQMLEQAYQELLAQKQALESAADG